MMRWKSFSTSWRFNEALIHRSGWRSGIACQSQAAELRKQVEWLLRPSDLCVLRIEPERTSKFDYRVPRGEELKLVNDLELELRARLSLPALG